MSSNEFVEAKVRMALDVFRDATAGVIQPTVLFLGSSLADAAGIEEGHMGYISGMEVQRVEDSKYLAFGFKMSDELLYNELTKKDLDSKEEG